MSGNGIDCPRAGRLIGGCKFEARYDLGTSDSARLRGVGALNSWASDMPQMLEATRSKTYVHDICIRCGKVVKRP